MTSIYHGRPDLVADARALDRSLRPIVDRVLARLGITREQVLAEQPTPPPVAATPGRETPKEAA